jgi:hypothetical protein
VTQPPAQADPHTRNNVMEGYLTVWMNVAALMSLVGIFVWLTLLPSTNFFGDDD